MHPTTAGLQAAIDRLQTAVDSYIAVALLPLDAMDRRECDHLIGVALGDANAADAVVDALMPLIKSERPRGSFDVLHQATRHAWATLDMAATLALRAATPDEQRAADRAQALALHAYQRAGDRYSLICGWLAEAIRARYESEARDAAA